MKVIVEMGLRLPIIISKAREVKEAVRNYPEAGVYVSRGGTAEALSELHGKKAVELSATFMDLLEPIQRIARTWVKKMGWFTSDCQKLIDVA